MEKFLVKCTDGSIRSVQAASRLQGTVTTVSVAEDLQYEKIDYLELLLHADPIYAGDAGYYIVGAGNGRCQNRDYGIGTFKEREDCTVVLDDCFLPLFGLQHGGNTYIAIVTGMRDDISQVIEIKDNQYFIKIRFMIDGTVPYEPISVEFHTLDRDATYCDMAKAYRAYQLERGYQPLKERLTPELSYALDAINVRIRMAWKPVPCPVAEQTPENEPPVHTACTFDDVIRIMELANASDSFTSTEVQKALGKPKPTTARLLKKMCDASLLTMIGAGRSTRYQKLNRETN